MEIGLDDIDVDDFFEPMSYWAMQTGVWDGRPVTYENIPHFQEQIQKKILTLLFSQEAESLHFQRMMAYLALAGANENERSLLEKDIEELKLTPVGMIIQTGFRKKTKKFWKKHWKKVVIGAVVVAATVVVVTVSVSSGGTAAAPVTAAAGSQLEKLRKKKRKKDPKSNVATGPDPKRLKPEKPTSSLEIGSHSQTKLPSFLEHESPTTTPPTQTDFFEPPPVTKEMLRHTTTPESLFPSSIQRKQESLLPHSAPHKSPHSSLAPPPTKPKPEKPLSLPKTSPTLEILKQANREVVFPSHRSEKRDSFLHGTSALGSFPAKLEGSSLPKYSETKPKQTICCIGGINGIDTTAEYAEGHAAYLKSFAGQDVEWVYNKTHGKVPDLTEALLLNYQGFSPNTAKELKENWIAFHEKHKDNPKVKYLQFCHSQGAIHVKNALESLPKEIRDRVIVVAIAPAAVVPDEICYKSFNYASKKDIVYLGERISFADITNGVPVKLIETTLKHEKELILLDPHPDTKGIDHDFQSPTFREKLKDHIEEHLSKNGEYE